MRTPCFVIRESDLLHNLERIAMLKQISGAKILLALKCFSTWGVFPIIQPYLDGTTSSSPFEAKLGKEKFGGETHAFSVGYSAEDVLEVVSFSDKIIFNSLSQLASHRHLVPPHVAIGIRLNPETAYAKQDKTNPARAYSRLGSRRVDLTESALEGVSGAMFHMNCENADFPAFKAIVDKISADFGAYLDRMDWVSLGGGIAYTWDDYPLEACAQLLREFAERHSVQVYLEPGEAVITRSTDMLVTVLDIVVNEKATAIVDSATEAHRLDTLIFDEPPKIREATETGEHAYFIASCSCLAGDVFCTAKFDAPLQVGDRLHVLDSAGYTMVKLNWFNGLRMPSVYCQRVNGELQMINQFSYQDYVDAMSRSSISG